MKKMMIFVVMSLATSSFVSFAQSNDQITDRQAKMQARFQAMDSNRDGKLSYEEMQKNPEHRARFDKVDLNHDGGLTVDEMKQAHQEMKKHRHERHAEMREKIQRMDVNQDQALTRAEIGNQMPKLLENFDIIDGNNDGKITRDEMQIARKAMRAEREAQAK
jgi:Ca2+-binding EF-hand superfamily protein